MKKFILLAMALTMASMAANAQVFDGITQPTPFRLCVPSTINAQTTEASVSPFVGFKYELAPSFSVTTIAQYSSATNAVVPQVWLNLNVAERFYLLTRSAYDIGAGDFKQGLASTVKLPLGFMVDCTWDNIYSGHQFLDNDRLQVVGGYAYKWLVFNVGYSMRHSPGLIANARFKATEYTWLQLKYDGGLNAVSITSLFNI